MAALFRGAFVQRMLVPALTLASLGAAVGLTIWQWETGDLEPIVENALAVDTLALGAGLIFYAAAILTVLLSLRSEAVRVAGAGEYFALLLVVGRRHGRARERREPGHAVRRPRAAVDPAVRAVRDRGAARRPRSSRA